MKGLKLVWSPFKTLGIIEFRVMINAYPLDLVLKLPKALPTLEDLLNFPFRLLIIDDRQRGFLVLPWQWVPWVLAKEFWGENIM
jgi:hypothetical protein